MSFVCVPGYECPCICAYVRLCTCTETWVHVFEVLHTHMSVGACVPASQCECVCVSASVIGMIKAKASNQGVILLSLKWERPEAEGQHRSQAPGSVPRPCHPGGLSQGAREQAQARRGQGQNLISLLEVPSSAGGCGAWETGKEEGEGGLNRASSSGQEGQMIGGTIGRCRMDRTQ